MYVYLSICHVERKKKKSLFKSILGLVCELHTRNKISNVLSLLTCQLMTQLKPPSESLCESVFDEKVYDVSGTPHQQVVGVSKPNKKLTFV